MKNAVNRSSLVVVLMLGSIAASAASAAAPPTCSRLLVARSEAPAAYVTAVSAVEILDLDLVVAIPWKLAKDWKGEHRMEIDVLNPRGNVYQSIEFDFVVEKRGRKSSLFTPGQHEPVEAELMTLAGQGQDKYLGVKARLPVAGSSIMQNSMYGTWSVVTRVDGAVISCDLAGTLTFQLNQ